MPSFRSLVRLIGGEVGPLRHHRGISALTWIENGGWPSFPLQDRSSFLAEDVVCDVWQSLELPAQTLKVLNLIGDGPKPALPSSFKIGILAQSSIALSALIAAQIHALRTKSPPPAVHVRQQHAVVEFMSERLYTFDSKPPASAWGPISGLYETSDGHVRVHANFPHHAQGTLQLMGLPPDATREQLAQSMKGWKAEELETVATTQRNLVIYALRSFREWDSLPQSAAINSFPIDITQISSKGSKGLPDRLSTPGRECLSGVRVVEMSRVVAAPVAGKTLAAHGADVIWVTSPTLPDIPTLDRDLGRGKRTVQLDIKNSEDKDKLIELLRTADIFIQGYRPDSLAEQGLTPEFLAELNPTLVVANLSAFGPRGPWSKRRGFDSLVQTCSGMNVSEAEHCGKGSPAMATPCQSLDHAGGYLLATAAMTGLYRRIVLGGSWRVDVSLAGVMRYLRSLGQYPDDTGFDAPNYVKPGDVPNELFESKDSAFGNLRAIKHSAQIGGVEVGWTVMPKPLGSDRAEWG